jgi:predicted ATP-dependent serine protease
VNWKILWAAVTLAAFCTPAPAQTPAPPAEQKNEVALALVLAVDASGSVDNRRFELQKQGYARAIVPQQNAPRQPIPGLVVHAVATLAEAIEAAFQR